MAHKSLALKKKQHFRKGESIFSRRGISHLQHSYIKMPPTKPLVTPARLSKSGTRKGSKSSPAVATLLLGSESIIA